MAVVHLPMQPIESRFRYREIVLATLVIAGVIGALCFYIFERANAATVGAGAVTVVGFWAAACFAKDRDRVSEPRFTMTLLLEVFVALALTLTGFQFIASLSMFEECPSAPAYIVFYGLKLILTFVVRSRVVARDPRFKRLSVATYCLLVVTTSGLTSDAWHLLYDAPLWLGVVLLFWTVGWFTVPTATFVMDILSAEGAALRYTVWRSVLEILFLSPIFFLVVEFVFVFVLMLFGVFPFASR